MRELLSAAAAGPMLATDDIRLVCKREYRWTETGKRVRDAVLDAVEGGAQ